MYPFPALAGTLGGGFPDNIISYSTNQNHRACVLSNGELWTQGVNGSGEIGNGDTTGTFVMSWFKAMNNVKKAQCGRGTTVAITNDNKIFYSGLDAPFGNFSSSRVFIEATSLVAPSGAPYAVSDIVEFQSAVDHSLFLLDNGDLWGFGTNTKSQLGVTGRQVTPIKIASNVKKFSAGGRVSVYLTTDGKLYTCGDSSSTLGYGPPLRSFTTFTELTPSLYDPTGTTNFVRDFSHNEQLAAGTLQITTSTGPTGNTTVFTGFSNNSDDPDKPTDGQRLYKVLSLSGGDAAFYPNTMGDNSVRILTKGGNTYVVGTNGNGQLGIGSTSANIDVYTILPRPSGIEQADILYLSIGDQTTMEFVARGRVYVAGTIGGKFEGGGTANQSNILKRMSNVPRMGT